MTRLFEEIKLVLSQHLGEKWDTKSGLPAALKKAEDRATAAKLVQLVEQKCSEFLGGKLAAESRPSSRRDKREKLLDPARKKEEALERLLAAAHPDLCNRYNFLSGVTSSGDDDITRNMAVDMVVVRDQGESKVIAEFVELKASDSRDNPLSALLQATMYYFLRRGLEERRPDLELTPLAPRFCIRVLAPVDYYRSYHRIRYQDVKRLVDKGLAKVADNLTDLLTESAGKGRTVRATFSSLRFSREDESAVRSRLDDIRQAIQEALS